MIELLWILAIPVTILVLSLYIIQPNERALREFLGKPGETVGPGLRFALFPLAKFSRYSAELVELPLTLVGILTKAEGDHKQVKMEIRANLYLYWPDNLQQVRKFLPADKAELVDVLDEQTAQAVRMVLSEKTWTDIWSKRKACGDQITQELKDDRAYALQKAGVTEYYVVIKDVIPPPGLEAAISDPEVARLQKEAIITRAEGEREKIRREAEGTSDKIRMEGIATAEARNALFNAIGTSPDRVKLELLHTLREMAQGTSNTILFPIPSEVTDAIASMFGGQSRGLNIQQLLNTLTPEQRRQLLQLLSGGN